MLAAAAGRVGIDPLRLLDSDDPATRIAALAMVAEHDRRELARDQRLAALIGDNVLAVQVLLKMVAAGDKAATAALEQTLDRLAAPSAD